MKTLPRVRNTAVEFHARARLPRWRRAWLSVAMAATGISPGLLAQTQSSSLAGSGYLPTAAFDPLVALYKEGVEAFDAGNYEVASAKLADLIKQAVNPEAAATEPAYFDLAAAHYNLRRYDQAIEAFKTYRAKYPQSPRLADVGFSLANCYAAKKEYDPALAELKPLENSPRRDLVLLTEGGIYSEQKKPGLSIPPLEALIKDGLRTSSHVRGALLLASAYVQEKQFPKATAVMVNIQNNLDKVDNILRFNALVIELGDRLLLTGLPRQSLALYRFARTRQECIDYQANRVAIIDRAINTAKENFQRTKNAAYTESIPTLRQLLDECRKALDDVKAAPDFGPGLLLRMARAYQETGRTWEASVANRQLVDQFPEAKEREGAYFGLVVAMADANQPKKALEACEGYLKAYPAGPNASAASYLRGTLALDAGDYGNAINYFGTAVKDYPEGEYADRMSYMIGTANLMRGEPQKAMDAFRDYLNKFPMGFYAVESRYRIGLCLLQLNKYQEALDHFVAFIKDNPSTEFTPDARYRLMIVRYAAGLYEEVIADAQKWEKLYPSNQIKGEVLAMKADALVATDQREEAAQAYIASYLAATSDEVLTYSLFEAGKMLGRLGHWDQNVTLFEEFVRKNPEHAAAASAIVHLIQARVKLGQVDQAKAFAAETIARFIADPSKEAVEKLITQLASICARKRVQGVDPKDDLAKVLTFTPEQKVPDSPTVKVRLEFARAELATATRRPKDHDDIIAKIADGNKPSDLSPILLGLCGDSLLQRNNDAGARAMYETLVNLYPKSEALDFAYNGLGDLAYRSRDYKKALGLYNKALDLNTAAYRIKEATMGKAKSLAASNDVPEAVTVFEQIVSTKEWRGEVTAEAIYNLGDIEMNRADYAKAIGYYQKVFVAFQKFPKWTAKAYLQSARASEKLGKNQDAIATLREMLANEKLANSDELDEARKQLAQLGQS